MLLWIGEMDQSTPRPEQKGSLWFAVKIGGALVFGVCFAVLWYGAIAWGATRVVLALSKVIFG